MIGQLRGVIVQQKAPMLVLDVNGVGYELQAPMTTFYRLSEAVKNGQEPLTLYTHLQVREDAHQLFGFFQPRDRQLFRELIKVSGVGPKLALAILSGMDVETFVAAIRHQDVKSLVSLPGLGKKTAERLVIEMQDRLKNMFSVSENNDVNRAQDAAVVDFFTESASQPVQEAEEALVALGYKPQQARQTIAKLDLKDVDSEVLIKSALQSLVR